MKNFVITLISFFAVSQLMAQTSEAEFINSLSIPSLEGARVIVRNDTPINFNTSSAAETVRGFRVRIFFDNKQTSRSDAHLAELEFKKLYPDIPTYVEYVAPYFKVTVGSFLSKREAVSIWGKLLRTFPTAFVIRENIPINELTTVTENIPSTDMASTDILSEQTLLESNEIIE